MASIISLELVDNIPSEDGVTRTLALQEIDELLSPQFEEFFDIQLEEVDLIQ